MSGDSRGKDNRSSLAHRAQQKYNAGKYVEAIDALQKLSEEIAPDRDLKVQHNLVVAGFVSGKYAAHEFEQNLRNLLSAHADETDRKQAAGSNATSTPDAESIESEAAFLRYNLAASLFQQKQYAAASAVLDVLVRNIEPIDERVAMHVCFLYLDLVLHSSRGCVSSERERQAALKKAQAILAYLEQPHEFNGLVVHPGEDTAGSAGATSTNTGADSAAAAGTGSVDETKQQAKKDSLDVVEFRFRLHLYKAKLVLLQSNLKTAKKEVKSALEIFQKEIRTRGDETSGQMHAMIEKTSANIGHPSLAVQKTTGLFLKANLEYLRANHKKCIKLLAACSQQAVDESIFLNNMGCIHFQMGQRKAAHSYFARALQASTKSRKLTTEPVVLTNSSQFEIMYNNGLQLLLQGEYALAFRCFHTSSRLLFNRPKLWLRMGECCTAAYAQQARVDAIAGNKSGLIQGVVGAGSHRRVLLSTSQPTSAAQNIDLPEQNGRPTAVANGPDGTPKMNLPFAAKCFKNVVLLCSQLLDSNKANGTAATAATTASPAAGTDENGQANSEALDVLRQKALANLAYVYLAMFEPQLAIMSAQQLLGMPTCSKANRFLARSYAAEGLCMLSRAQEATQLLQTERELLQGAEAYASEAHLPANQAKAALHANKAVTLLLQDQTAQAEPSVSHAVSEHPSCRESLELLVYFYLKKGETKKALRVLKEAQVTA